MRLGGNMTISVQTTEMHTSSIINTMKLYLKNHPSIECIECTPEELQIMVGRDLCIDKAIEEITEDCMIHVLLID